MQNGPYSGVVTRRNEHFAFACSYTKEGKKVDEVVYIPPFEQERFRGKTLLGREALFRIRPSIPSQPNPLGTPMEAYAIDIR